MPAMSRFFHQNNLLQRVHFLGKLQNQELVDAYHAINAFVFSSKSETQGLVLAEAMAAGVPVIGLDAPGVREVISDEINGYLLREEQPESFAHALSKMSHLPDEARNRLIAEAKKTAESFSMANCTSKLVSVYETLRNRRSKHTKDDSLWRKSAEQLKTEWELLSNLTSAVENAITEKDKI
jgi:glycosyltransferase involved in cell wall biosynthesis